MNIAVVVPHIFMQDGLLKHVIFSPAELAIELAEGLQEAGHTVYLYTPGPVATNVQSVTSDMSGFEAELQLRGYGYTELLKKHPLTFASLARQVQADLIAKAYNEANNGKIDVVHMFANEEDIGLQFALFCHKPVVFTHHDPFNLTVGYKYIFPRKKDLNYIALSESQKLTMPSDTNWVATIPNGLPLNMFKPGNGDGEYIAYLGRIIYSKGVHLAVQAVRAYNAAAKKPIKLRIAGKYYDDEYFAQEIQPYLGEFVEYVGFMRSTEEKQAFLGSAVATIVPSIFEEPFGMVVIESLACGTPVIGLNSGALPDNIKDGHSGINVHKTDDDLETSKRLAAAISKAKSLSRQNCRQQFESRFTIERMIMDHIRVYQKLVAKS